MPLYPRNVASLGACLESLLFHCFHFRLSFESIKELGNALGNMAFKNATLKIGIYSYHGCPWDLGSIGKP
jgi:hypothetical protein